jgi:phage repressor protein C with HTH and peptisase S24 domain
MLFPYGNYREINIKIGKLFMENITEAQEVPQEPKSDSIEFCAGIGDRLFQIRGRLSQQEFADSVGISKTTYHRYEREERIIDVEVIARICEKYDYDYTWVITGKGTPHEGDRYVSIPQYDIAASAGMGTFVEDHAEVEMVLVDRNWLIHHLKVKPQEISMINVYGDSMKPTLAHGDVLIVSSDLSRLGDGIYVLRYDGLLQVKRLQFQPRNKIRVTSDNPMYRPYVVNIDQDGLEFRIVGKLIYTIKPSNS